MRYKGKIKNLEHLIVTDPHYQDHVSCRYNNRFENITNWNIELIISKDDYYQEYEGTNYHIEGISFNLLLRNETFKESSNDIGLLDKENICFPKSVEINSFVIGMDTAQVAIGTNSKAMEIETYCNKDIESNEDIIEMLDDYRPYFAICTLTDGTFGDVKEFKLNNRLLAISVNGWIDKDAEYDEQRILDYLKENLNIYELEIIKDEEKEI